MVESADTGPFSTTTPVKDLESAVAFYGTPAFQSSLVPAAIPVKISGDPNDPEVQAISAFLRVLNALENIRSSINVAERGRQTGTSEDARELAPLALAETVDALQVLSSGALAKSREVSVLTARIHLFAAKIALELGSRLHSPTDRARARSGYAHFAGGAIGASKSGYSAGKLSQLRSRFGYGTQNEPREPCPLALAIRSKRRKICAVRKASPPAVCRSCGTTPNNVAQRVQRKPFRQR